MDLTVKEQEEIYCVQLSQDTFDDFISTVHFCSKNRITCEKYVNKFNKVRQKVIEFYYKKHFDDDMVIQGKDLIAFSRYYNAISYYEAKVIIVNYK